MGFLIRRLPFWWWVREITQKQLGNMHFQAAALLTLQEAVEAYIVGLFEEPNHCTIHAKWVTVMPWTFNWHAGSWGYSEISPNLMRINILK